MTLKPRPEPGISTRAIHVGQGPDETTGAVVLPIHLATTFAQDDIAQTRSGYEYSRTGNPTRQALESCLASLENAGHCRAFASGLAATTTLFLGYEPGDHFLYMHDVYGGTYRLFEKVLRPFGLQFTPVDATDLEAVKHAINGKTRGIWLETPTNPLLQIVDIAGLSHLAHSHGLAVFVDNTFATPVLQQPLSLGADVVVHSATKYLGGHSDVVGGAVLVNDEEMATRLAFNQNAAGAVPSPFDCWLLLRGIKTLELRVLQQCRNAARVAEYLSRHPAVSGVNYPGLEKHPQHDVARRQMRDFGAMVSFDVAGEKAARSILRGLRLFTLAESLGAVESLAEHPAGMTHAAIPKEVRRAAGIGDGLIRLSVGIENIDDLLADLDQALEGAA